MWWWYACAQTPTASAPTPLDPTPTYAERVAAIARARDEVATWSDAALRAWLTDRVELELVPAWIDTGWDFYGTAAAPGAGDIACGHFVGTILRDAGFELDRLAVGALASEHILGLFTSPAERRRFRDQTPDQIAAALEAAPDGWYGVGLDFHAGMLFVRDGHLRFCHSSWVVDRVTCEDPRDSRAFPSRYTVVAPFLTDRALAAWRARAPITPR
ncbi:MAG: hypothetical protein ABMA64_17065 [Myxococcota bacterium]